ncbi:MAG: hypothetical protein AB1896_16575 [Thermodesulfobacteriota bacterium]
MKKSKAEKKENPGPSFGEKLMVYSLTAGAVLTIPQNVNATIRYVQPSSPWSVPLGSGFDVDGDGVKEFTFFTSDSKALLGQHSSSPYAEAINQYQTTYTYSWYTTVAAKLPSSYSVKSGITYPYYWGWGGESAPLPLNNSYDSIGFFNSGADGYLGVRFVIPGPSGHYGWIHYQGNAGANTGQILDWAYEDAADTPILAGDKGGEAPTANGAGSPTSVNVGATVTLDGSLSTDPNDPTGAYSSLSTIATYNWVQTAGTPVTLSGGGPNPIAQFTAPNVGPPGEVLTFQLMVTDVTGLSSLVPDTVDITVNNSSTQSPAVAFPPGATAASYRMSCWPVIPNGAPATGQQAFGSQIGQYDNTMMRIGYWNPNVQAYSEYPDLGLIEPGWAGWFLFRNGKQVTLTGPPAALSTGPNGQPAYPYPLKWGWNMIGNPFSYSIDISTIMVEADGGGWAYLTASGNTITQKIFWIYNNGNYEPATVLPTGVGGWVKIYSGNGTIWFQPISASPDKDYRVVHDLADEEKPPAPPGGDLSATGGAEGGGGGGGGCFVSGAK